MILRLFALSVVFIGILGFSGQAHAQVLTWDWSYSSFESNYYSYEGSGTLTTGTTPDGEGNYLVTSISGDWEVSFDNVPFADYTITDLAAPGAGVIDGNDNLISAASPQVTVNGISFSDSSSDLNVIYNTGDGDGAASGTTESVYGSDSGGEFSAAIVPEPSQYGFLLALTAAGFIAWRRFFRSARL